MASYRAQILLTADPKFFSHNTIFSWKRPMALLIEQLMMVFFKEIPRPHKILQGFIQEYHDRRVLTPSSRRRAHLLIEDPMDIS